jgi:hypothetical protein
MPPSLLILMLGFTFALTHFQTRVADSGSRYGRLNLRLLSDLYLAFLKSKAGHKLNAQSLAQNCIILCDSNCLEAVVLIKCFLPVNTRTKA